MTTEPKISVIIPVYNTAEYLPRCLDSILGNTYRNLEVICVNDGSTDNSAVIIEQYSAADDRVIAVDQANAGVSAARNTGLDRATGDFIAFIDSDDWVHPQYFEILNMAQAKCGACIIACKYISTRANRSEYAPINVNTVEILPVSNVEALKIGYLKRLVWGRLYKRSAISGFRFRKELRWGEDTVFSIDSLCSNSSIALIDLKLYYYFQRETSAMRTIQLHDKLGLAKFYMTHYGEVDLDIKRHVYLSESIKHALSCRYSEMFAPNHLEQLECETMLKECREKLKQSEDLNRKEKLIFNAFILMPFLYRIFRIISDPSLLQWEKKMKQDK